MQDAFAHCEALVRAADKDRFLTTLFAPAERRDALFALYAFNVEIARVREVVREPVAGEIRLQWWSDVLGGAGRGEVAAHPVASALLASIARYRLPAERFKALIEARRFDLYDEPDIGALSHHAGLAHALAGLLAAFPIHAARGQLYIPLEILARHGGDRQDARGPPATPQLLAALAELRARARRHLCAAQELLATAAPAVMPALLPVALAPPTLARMERRGYDPFVPVAIAPWRRQLIIWRAARRPRRIFG
jgi:phytoene synthase